MPNDKAMIMIPLWKYDRLIDTETRVDVAVDLIANDKYISAEEILRILGTELAIQVADELRDKYKE